MYSIKPAYNIADRDYQKLSPSDVINLMYEGTDKGGIMVVPDHPYEIKKGSEGDLWLSCKMAWTKKDRDEVIEECKSLYKAISRIAKVYYDLGPNRYENEELLSEEDADIWSKYLRDLDNGHFEKDIERSIYRICDERINRTLADGHRYEKRKKYQHMVDKWDIAEDEQIFLYWRHIQSLRDAVKARFGQSVFAFDLCIRMKRLFYMMAFEAPKGMIRREAKRLAKYMVLSKYCESVEHLETDTGFAFPMENLKNVDAVCHVLTTVPDYDFIPDKPDALDGPFFDQIFYSNAKSGEGLMDIFDLYRPFHFDSAYQIMQSFFERSKEVDLGVENIEVSCYDPLEQYPGYMMVSDKPWEPNGYKVPTEEEAKKVLRKIADYLGADKKTIKHCMVRVWTRPYRI